MSIAAVDHDQQWLRVSFTDGTTERFLGLWLRDNVDSGRHRDHGQRTFDINSLGEVSIESVTHTSDDVAVKFAPEGLDETFDETWLRGQGAGPSAVAPPTFWASERQSALTFADYPSLQTDPAALRAWLASIRDLGFGLLENVPNIPGTIFEVVDLFGYVRETNYGRLFDVRVESDPANLAFTSGRIDMHTDNPYRDPVPGLQLLHCLVNDSDGGDNQLCDGFAVANQIRHHHPEAFELLTTQLVRFRFVENGSADLQALVPLIQTDAQGEIAGVRYNSRSIQAFDMPADVLADYYEAYRVFGQALQDPAAAIEFRLDPGQLMIFDNQRVLHARTSYQVGDRHLQGCYADKDSLHSRIRVLERLEAEPTGEAVARVARPEGPRTDNAAAGGSRYRSPSADPAA